MLITIGEAVAYVVSGMYGDVRDLGTINAILIILQARSARGAQPQLRTFAHNILPRAASRL